MKLHKINIKDLIIIYLILPISLFLTSLVLADSTIVILSFPAPAPSPQGLAWDGNFLWVADDSTDTLYKIEPEDGSIISSFPTPGTKPRGLTWDGNHLWCADMKTDTLYKLEPSDASVISSIPAPHNRVHGLTWDGQYLYCCYEAGWSSQIVKIDLSDTSTIFFTYTRGNPSGLAYDGNFIWNCLDNEGIRLGLVDQYELSTGLRVKGFDTPGYYPTALTYDGRYFWLADNNMDTLYEIKILTPGVNNPDGRSQNLPLSLTLYQNHPNPFNSMTLISYDIPFNDIVVLKIFNITGKCVKTLVDGIQFKGRYKILWNGKDDMGNDVSSGIHFYTIKIGDFKMTRKMLIVR